MANAIAPSGFTVVKSLGYYPGQVNTYYIPSSDGSQYGIGDMVKSATGADTNGIPAVQKSTGAASEYQRGVIVAVLPVQAIGVPNLQGVPLTLENIYIPATKTQGYYVMVNDDPNTVYELQDDGLSALTATSSNKNSGFTVANGISPVQISASVLTTSTVATTATLPLKLMGLSQRPGGLGNTFGINARWLVRINLHELNSAGTAGV